MTFIHRFITNASWNLGGKLFIQLIYFLVSVIISRYLGRELLGIYASILVVPAFVRLVNAFGLEGMLNKTLPELRVKDPTGLQARYLLKKSLALRVGSSLVFCWLLYLVLPFYAGWAKVPELVTYRSAIVLYFLVVTLNSLLGMVFMTYLKFKTVTIAEGLNACFNLFLLILFVFFDWGLWGILSAYILSTFAQIVLYLQLGQPYWTGPVQQTGLEEARHLAWTVYGINLLSIGLWTQSDIMLMNYFQVPQEGVGYYHLATSLGTMVIFMMAGIGQLAQSLYSERFTQEGVAGLAAPWKMTLGFTAWITLPIGVFTFAYAPQLITTFFGAEFAPAALVFRIYVAYLVTSSVLGLDLNPFALFVLNRRKTVLLISFEGSVWNLILDYLWIPEHGETGAALATGSVMVYMALRQLFALKVIVEWRPVLTIITLAGLVSLASLAPGFFYQSVQPENEFLGYPVFLFAGSFFLLMLLTKPLPPELLTWAKQFAPRLAPWVSRFVRT